MDQRERTLDEPEAMRIMLEALQSRLWTALPCVVNAFPAASGLDPMMLDAQPLIAGSYIDATGNLKVVQMPLLTDLPIYFPGGGGVTLTFPIQKGDECWVIFGSRCIDAWWQLGASTDPNNPAQPPPNARMHNLSDGVAFVGIRSKPRALNPVPSNQAAQLRSDDGTMAVAINPTAKAINIFNTQDNGALFVTVNGNNGAVNVNIPNGTATVTAKNGINLNGVTIDSNGNVNSPATITATTDVVGGGKHLKTHTHGGVQTGSGISGPPS